MYEAYWKLTHKPFGDDADARSYYPTEAHHGALLKLRYALESGAGAAVLAGESGTGKTLLAELLRRQFSAGETRWLQLVFPQLSSTELLRFLLSELAIDLPDGAGADLLWRSLESAARTWNEKGARAVIVVDEAHLLSSDALETLRLLLNLGAGGQRALSLLLVGQTELLLALDRRPDWEGRLAVKCLLRRLSLEETASYVSHRLAAAGAIRPLFEPAALDAVYQLTQGVPRKINRLCDLALLIGFAEDRHGISAEQVEAIADELVHVASG